MSRIPNNDIIIIGQTGWKTSLPLIKFLDNNNMLVNENMESIVKTNSHPWKYEFLEQYLTNKWITKNDVVLELGSRLGIVSLTINSRLSNKHNHVVVEPNKIVIPALKFNKKSFGAKFKVCTKVISNKSMKYVITNDQLGNYTVENSETNSEQNPIKIIIYDEFIKKYNLNFNVLVADCEGCLGQFFAENEQILSQLDLIIFEKDNIDRCDYDKIFTLLKKYNFIFRDGLINNTKNYENYFQQVWTK
jgi:hypothetical protein